MAQNSACHKNEDKWDTQHSQEVGGRGPSAALVPYIKQKGGSLKFSLVKGLSETLSQQIR